MQMKSIVAVLALTLSGTAWAQYGDGPPPPPPPPPGYEVGLPPPPPPGFQPVLFRWGIDGSIGYFFPAQAVDFGASLRLGAQLNRLIGVYADVGYTVGIGFGGSVSSSSAAVSVSALGFWHIAPMAEFDFGKYFVAVGPMLAGGGWAQVIESADSAGNASQYAVAAGGVMPGFDVRTGLTFGDRTPWGRLGGFTLALDVKVLVGTASTVTQNAGPSGASQSVHVGDPVWAVTPTLVLGFDAR